MKANCGRRLSVASATKFLLLLWEEDDREGDIKTWEIKDSLEENIQTGKFRIPAFIKLVLDGLKKI